MSHIFSLQCAFHACAWICFCFCFWFGLVFWVPSFCHTNAGIHQKIHFPESTTSYTHGNHRLQSSRPHSPGTFTLPWILNQCFQPHTHSIYTHIYIWSNTLCAYLNLPSLLIQWLIFWFLILPCFFMFQAPEHIYSDDTAQTPVQFSLHAH